MLLLTAAIRSLLRVGLETCAPMSDGGTVSWRIVAAAATTVPLDWSAVCERESPGESVKGAVVGLRSSSRLHSMCAVRCGCAACCAGVKRFGIGTDGNQSAARLWPSSGSGGAEAGSGKAEAPRHPHLRVVALRAVCDVRCANL